MVYKTVVRPAMIYRAETWPINKAQEKSLDVTEMRILRWMCGIIRIDSQKCESKRKNQNCRDIQEIRLQLYGHVMVRANDYVVRRVMAIAMEGKRGRGRQRRKWMDWVKMDLGEKGLSGEEVEDRALWRRLIRNVGPT